MAQETIDAIRQAETAAEAAEKEAVKEAEAIVAEAKAQAAQMKAEMTKSAREGAMGAEEDAKAQSEQMMQAAGAEEGKDLEALQKAVAEKHKRQLKLSYQNCYRKEALKVGSSAYEKVLICGLKKDRKGTLELLQRKGYLKSAMCCRKMICYQKMDVTSSKTVFERNAIIAEQDRRVILG